MILPHWAKILGYYNTNFYIEYSVQFWPWTDGIVFLAALADVRWRGDHSPRVDLGFTVLGLDFAFEVGNRHLVIPESSNGRTSDFGSEN